MKRYMIMLAAAMTAVACSEPEIDSPVEDGASSGVSVTCNGFKAGFEGADTKVALQSDWSLHWEAEDAVAVWDGESEDYKTYTAPEAGAEVTLTGDEVDVTKAHYAFYPYADELSFAGTGVTAVIPSVQTPVKDNFPYNPSVAYAAAGSQDFIFCNICGLVAFEITSDNVSNVVVYSGNGEPLTGKVTVDCTSSAPQATVVEGKDHVILQAADAEGAADVFAPGKYYVSVLPHEFTKGITVTMNTKDGQQAKRIRTAAFTLNRSHRINASTIDADVTWSGNQITNAAELQAFLNVASNCSADAVATLADDIDMEGFSLTPATSFAGTFEGNGKTISNWETTAPLFTTLTGTVRNLNTDGVLWIDANNDAAYIALNNAGTIENCTTSGTARTLDNLNFEKERAVGAIAARTTGTITGCTNNVSITLAPASTVKWDKTGRLGQQFVGGIAGYASGTDGSAKITDCKNAGPVTYHAENGYISSMSCVGGILGGTPSTTYAEVADWTPVNNAVLSGCQNLATASITYGYKKRADDSAYNNVLVAGVVGYLEGVISSSSNAAQIKIDGFRTTDGETGNYFVKNVSVAGVAGIVTGNVTSCTNSGKIDFSATVTSGDTASEYIGPHGYSAVGGVVAKTCSAANVAGCENTGALVVDMHMRQKNGSGGAIGGVVGVAYKSTLAECTNRGTCEWDTRTCVQTLGGVCGYYMVASVVPYSLKNYGNITCDAGTITAGAGRQSVHVNLGGVLGRLEGSDLDIRDKEAFYNEGAITYTGGNPQSSNTGDNSGTFNSEDNKSKKIGQAVGGICGLIYKARTRGSETQKFINRGTITVSKVSTLCYVAGVNAYQCGLSANAYGVAQNNSENHGAITVTSSSAKLSVGGVYGRYTQRCVYNGLNTAAINVANTGGDVRVGGVIADCSSLYSMTMTNTGDITVTKSGSGYVCAAGVSAAESKTLGNSVVTYHTNSGNVSLTSSAGDSYLGGVTAYDNATNIWGTNTGDLTFEYNGDGLNNPVLYAGLIAGHHHNSCLYHVADLAGTLTLKNVGKVTCHCGALAGYMSSNGAILTTYTNSDGKVTDTTISIKKTATVNGVSPSLDDESYIAGTNDGTAVDMTDISLVD